MVNISDKFDIFIPVATNTVNTSGNIDMVNVNGKLDVVNTNGNF